VPAPDSNRSNLQFAVVATSQAEKLAHVHQVLEHDLPAGTPGGAIVYCSSRRHTEETAAYLREKGLSAGHFHAGLPPAVSAPERLGDLAMRLFGARHGIDLQVPERTPHEPVDLTE